ncbi:hypothetical protein BX667DRAFT_505518 [Coemansia mojavensis]|nr:hypothetical protein BX667DRAFT_505518 [Coemansia mojavensis]
MLTHRKNWCRVCGICLTCPRTSKSVFQQGDCHCTEKQANHVNPSKVKGEMLFSFRYRHLSAEDIDILEELRPHFKFITPPIERNLVRANICSTCQQRLRRARISRRRKHPTSAQLNIASPAKNSNASSSENEEEKEKDALTVGFGQHRMFLPAARPHSAIRSTLPSTSEVATWLTRAQLRAQHQPQRTLKPAAAEAVDLRGSASRLFIDEPGSQLNAAAPLSVPVHPHRISHSPIGSKKLRGHPPNTLALNASYRQMCTPPNMSAFCKENSPDRYSVESPDEEMDETRVELEEYSAAHSRHVKLPPILGSQQIQPPLPLLPPPHAILPVNRVQLTSRNHKLYR